VFEVDDHRRVENAASVPQVARRPNGKTGGRSCISATDLPAPQGNPCNSHEHPDCRIVTATKK
jgi:hypothetical protein